MTGAGVLVVRDGRVLLSPRSPAPRVHLGWIGGGALAGETSPETAVREAWEEIGCDVALVDAPATYDEHARPCNTVLQGRIRPLLRLRDEIDVFARVSRASRVRSTFPRWCGCRCLSSPC